MEELLSAFQSMESQVLKIVQKSYEDQRESDAMVSSIESTRLQEKIGQLEEMLKTERKDKDRAERELRTLTDKFNTQEKRDNQLQEFEEKQRKMKVQMQQLQEQIQKEKSLVKSQEESLCSLRKMSESTKKDLEFMSGRVSQSNVEIQNLQERNATLSETEMKLHEEIEELKRQISIRDDRLHQLQEEDGFQEVVPKSKKVKQDDSNSKQKDLKQNDSNEVVIVIDSEKEGTVEETRNCRSSTKVTANRDINQRETMADVLLIGTSIIKDVEPGRMFRDRQVIKHVLEQKTIDGAKKYISGLEGKFKCILLQVGSNDLENSSPEEVERGLSEVVALLTTKQPDAQILVSGILPRWKKYAADGMNFKNKKTLLNEKLKGNAAYTFCPQDNFGRHMFYDGIHLNSEGTAQLVSNYKYMIGKTTIGHNRGDTTTYSGIVNKGTRRTMMTYGQRANEHGQRGGYRADGGRRQFNTQQRQSYKEQTGREQSDGSVKLQSLVKLLKDLMST